MSRLRARTREEGFTLIELLVVIIIIGVLAAIAIPLFLEHRNRAWDMAVQSDLRNAAIAQDAFLTEGDGWGHYATTVDQLESLGFRASPSSNYADGVFALSIGLSGNDYCLTARARSGHYLGLHSSSGLVTADVPLDSVSCS